MICEEWTHFKRHKLLIILNLKHVSYDIDLFIIIVIILHTHIQDMTEMYQILIM